jgi:exosortase
MLNFQVGNGRHALFILLSAALFAVMSGSIRELINYALDLENKNASQVLIIPLISATLIYLSRKSIFQDIRVSLVPGLLTILGGSAILFLAVSWAGAGMDQGDRIALRILPMLVIWWGGVVLFYGVSAFKAALFPMMLLVFCAPIPSPVMERTIHFLQHASADVSFLILQLTGTPIYRDGVFFFLPNLVVEVAPQCSGIRSGISLLILALVAAGIFLKSWPKRVAFLVMVVPIIVFKNGLRISTLSYLAVHVDQRILTSSLHKDGGIPFFLLALLLMYPVLNAMIKSEARITQRQPVREVRV